MYSSSVRVSLDLLSVQANTGPKWANKSSVAFFRGRDSRKERLELVRLSHRHPDLVDARLTNMFFFKHEEDLGELQKHISFFDFFQVCMTAIIRASYFPFKKINFPFQKFGFILAKFNSPKSQCYMDWNIKTGNKTFALTTMRGYHYINGH